ncbi:MAG: T9SS type B sorting domain-containing protein [Cecembia sp.]
MEAGPGILGEWFFERDGGERVFLAVESRFSINSNLLQGPGEYQFIFVVDDFDNRFCKIEDTVSLTILPEGIFVIEEVIDSDECPLENGSMAIRAITDIDRIELRKAGVLADVVFNISEGELVVLDGLGTGVYTLTSFRGSCSRWATRVINSNNFPEEFQFDIDVIDESCSETGLIDGRIIVRMLNQPFTGTFQLFNNLGLILEDKTGSIQDQIEFEISVERGNYMIELYDENGCTYTYEFIEGTRDGIIRVRSTEQVNFSTPSVLNICQSFEFIPQSQQELRYSLTYPDGTVVERNFNESFTLDQAGEYTILGSIIDEETGFCPRQRSFFVNVTQPVEYEPVLLNEDCFGNKTFEVQFTDPNVDISQLSIRWFNENDQVVGTGRFLFPTSFGEFKLDVQPINSEACPIPRKVFDVSRPVLELEVQLTASQLCPFEREAIISLQADLDEVERIEWLLYDDDNDGQPISAFEGLTEIIVENPGAYEVVLFNVLDCEIGRELILVEESENLANFDLPEALTICENYSFIPETTLDLLIKVTDPDGLETEISSGQPFTFTKTGEFRFESRGANEEDGLCRVVRLIDITVSDPIDFSAVLFEENCEGLIIYQAEFDADISEVEIYWYDSGFNLLEEGEFFQPSFSGGFYLEVKPQGSLSCPDPFYFFEVELPVLAVDLSLSGGFICEDPGFTLLSVETDLGSIDRLVWFVDDENGTNTELPQFENEVTVAVDIEGLYTVQALNRIGCVIAEDQILVLRSLDEIRPILEESYIICPFFEAIESIDPGLFELYEWFLNGELVFTDRVFTPVESGNYMLRVTNLDGCQFSENFTVVENCKFQVVYPNAVQPSNPQKDFKIYSNFLIDDLKVWIYNKWGQLLFHCSDADIFDKKASCPWDGTFEGEKLPTGIYVLKIQYKNRNNDAYESITDTIFIVD